MEEAIITTEVLEKLRKVGLTNIRSLLTADEIISMCPPVIHNKETGNDYKFKGLWQEKETYGEDEGKMKWHCGYSNWCEDRNENPAIAAAYTLICVASMYPELLNIDRSKVETRYFDGVMTYEKFVEIDEMSLYQFALVSDEEREAFWNFDEDAMEPNVLAYTRVSTKKQNMEYQKTCIKEYADKHGLKIDKWFEDDGISAYKTTMKEREGSKALIDSIRLKYGKTIILVTEYNRLSRNEEDTETLNFFMNFCGTEIICTLNENKEFHLNRDGRIFKRLCEDVDKTGNHLKYVALMKKFENDIEFRKETIKKYFDERDKLLPLYDKI